ncbi:hypothetical protein BH11PSE2_BH11PSE2_17920 [soil metagenome]
MTDAERLRIVRALHTAIYLVMASASFALLYAGVTGAHGPWLWWVAGLVAAESVVFIGSGFKCPLTAIAVKNGATRQGVADTFLPERMTRHTFHYFGPLIVLAAALLAWRIWWFGWA